LLDRREVARWLLLLYKLAKDGTIVRDSLQRLVINKLCLHILDEVLLLQFEDLPTLFHDACWILALLDLKVERHLIGAAYEPAGGRRPL
jgi:hypothetical protein